MRFPVGSALSVLLAGVVALVGCAAAPDEDEDTAASSGEALTRSITPNHLIDDALLAGGADVTAARVQAFLEEKGGYLSTYSSGGRSAATIITAASRTYGIHPAYLLARIQGESGLVSGGSASKLAHATGCGCKDGSPCSRSTAGFEQQVVCTASSMKGYLDDIAASGKTVSGWGPGITKKTFDPCTVKPDNAATAAIYTYNPWVGSYGIGCGVKNNGASTAIAAMTRSYASKL